MDPLIAPYRSLTGEATRTAIVEAPAEAQMRILLRGTTLEGEDVARGVLLPLGAPAATAIERLAYSGIDAVIRDDGFTITGVKFASQADKLGIAADFRIIAIEAPADRLQREWMFLPALALIAWVVRRQRLRRNSSKTPVPLRGADS